MVRMIASGRGLVAQWLSRLHRMWEDAGSNPVGPIPFLLGSASFRTAHRDPGSALSRLLQESEVRLLYPRPEEVG